MKTIKFPAYISLRLKRRIWILSLLLCVWTSGVDAEVYTLWPKGSSSGNDLDTCLRPRSILDEPVLINGASAQLKLGLLSMSLNDILRILKQKFPNAVFAAGGDSILVKLKLANGWHKRLLLVYFGDFFPVLQISMTLPPKLPAPSHWPQELIITSDGTAQRYLYFPERDTWYGRFKTSMEPDQALVEVNDTLSSQGWTAVTGEASGRRSGSGEIFLKKEPLLVMLVNFSPDGNAVVLARKLK